MNRRRRARAAAAVGFVAALALAGCAPAPSGSWAPPTWHESAVRVADPATVIDAGDGGELAGSLVPLRVRNDAVGVQARVALLPEGTTTDAFNAAIVQTVHAAIGARAEASGTAYAPAVAPRGAGLASRDCVAGSTGRPAADILADPELGPPGGSGTAVVCDIVFARGTVLAERVRVVTGDADAVAADTTSTRYVDTETGEVVPPEGLWTDAAAEALSSDIVEALRRDAGALGRRPASAGGEAQLAAVRAALATTVPTSEGLVITLAPGFAALELEALGVPAAEEPMSLAVPTATAAGFVSPFGTRVLASAGEPYAGPMAAPAGARTVDCSLLPCVAVTYDDGPSGFTSGILDELAAHGAAATFFALGSNARAHAETLARMTADGHEVANHTWNHPHLPDLTPEQVSAQIRDTSAALEAASGQRITAFRPPYGEYDADVLAAAGLPAILWDVDTLDWQGPPDDELIARAVDQPRPGSIVLMHDTHERTARVAGAVYDGLLDRGFTLVTVRQLFGGALPTSGAWRSAR